MIDPGAQACTALGIRQSGIRVGFGRNSGVAPRVVTFEVEVDAIVRMVIDDVREPGKTGYSASEPGALSQDDRQVIVMASDLCVQRFPVPIVKGDTMTIIATAERFKVIRVDPYKRAVAGAIELVVSGIS